METKVLKDTAARTPKKPAQREGAQFLPQLAQRRTNKGLAKSFWRMPMVFAWQCGQATINAPSSA
jgi:hypothetical protein